MDDKRFSLRLMFNWLGDIEAIGDRGQQEVTGAYKNGSYWIPGSSSVKFVVTDCLYRLYARVVTDAASLKKAL